MSDPYDLFPAEEREAWELADLAAGTPGNNGHQTTDLLAPQPVDWHDLWNSDTDQHDWLCEPLIPARRGIALIARYKTGKSLLGLHIAAALATGQPCLNQPAAPPIHVTYLDLEMSHDDLRERLESLGYDEHSDLTHLHYYLGTFPPLDTPAGGQLLTNITTNNHSTLVVIDTIGRATEGEESSADTIRGFYRYCGQPLKQAGITWIRLDHVGHTHRDRARGTSSKGEDVDVMWVLQETDTMNTFRLTSTSRTSWIPRELTLTRDDSTGTLTHTIHGTPTVPPGVNDCIADLDRLQAPPNITKRAAMALLRSNGCGRREEVVRHALNHRKSGSQNPGSTQPDNSGSAPPGSTTDPTPKAQATARIHPWIHGERVGGSQWDPSIEGSTGSRPHPAPPGAVEI